MPVRDDLLHAMCLEAAASIHARLPELKTCEAMAGQLGLNDIKAIGRKAPAVFVSRLGARQVKGDSVRVHYHATMAAYVLTRDGLGLKRDPAAQAICQAILHLVPDADWFMDEVGPAENVRDQSLNTRATKEEGVALWAVTWSQPFVLEVFSPEAPIPPEVYVGHAPEVGSDHEADYEQIEVTP